MEGRNRIDAIPFQTRARTIDHLGREQIADCPTAISELWKNSYDAYAQSVALHIFDGDIPTAALVDDGHGMSRREFVERWLVVGTESKASSEQTSKEDRNGLPLRQRQGQKGIGRLSSAALGPLLLLVSKRRMEPFIASLVDWRLFENPFLFLQDIEIPVVDFVEKETLLQLLPQMFDRLMGNVWGNGTDPERDARIAKAWQQFDVLNGTLNQPLVREGIENRLVGATLGPRQLEQWGVWSAKSDCGTALIVADISFDLEAQLPSRISAAEELIAKQAKDKLFSTLCNFTDPFADLAEAKSVYAAPEFRYSVTAWEGSYSVPIVSQERSFGYQNLEDLEHVIEGRVDAAGVFVGRVKAFGKVIDGEIRLAPKSPVPARSDSKVGPFHLRLGTFEQSLNSSTHPPEIHARLREQADRYAGFMVYRNGLRVMPYGSEDNDFFEIEKRRNLNAGREFWANRNLFGRAALTREFNPNLKDKAGREGLIDNKATKVFRDLIENILMITARRYFGSSSELRNEVLPEIKAAHERAKFEEARNKLRARKRREFRHNLELFIIPMRTIKDDLEKIAEDARGDKLPSEEIGLLDLRERVAALKQSRSALTVGQAPSSLGSLEPTYREFRACSKRADELIENLSASLSAALEKIKPRSPRDRAYSTLSRNAAFLQDRLRKWSAEARQMLSGETNRILQLVEERNKSYHAQTLPLLEELEAGHLSLAQVLDKLDAEKERQDQQNQQTFEPYLSTLRDLQESVDIEMVANVSMADAEKAQDENARLNSLAQLGITVEIIGHEIEGLDGTISRGINELYDKMHYHPSFQAIKSAHEALSDRLRFLSPLKLSGERVFAIITGQQIFDYVSTFLDKVLERNSVSLDVSPAFLRFSVYEQPARIYPVFINLVNNAAYWVGQTRYLEKHVLLDVWGNKVVVSDDGPGVDPEDVDKLFSLFFTRKVRGGRGVGLYLCRANLSAGGHTISYASDARMKRLPGANFVIDFKGATYE
jgi:signal transduction histidine kinase